MLRAADADMWLRVVAVLCGPCLTVARACHAEGVVVREDGGIMAWQGCTGWLARQAGTSIGPLACSLMHSMPPAPEDVWGGVICYSTPLAWIYAMLKGAGFQHAPP